MEYFYIYIMSNKTNTVLYIGVTNNIIRRAYEHKEKIVDGFTKKYNAEKLVYYEIYNNSQDAIAREKQLKKWRREKKLDLIKQLNPTLNDLYDEITN